MFQTLKRAIAPKMVVKDIHDAFDNSAEKLLSEAKKIIASPSKSMGDRLSAVGFTSSRESEVSKLANLITHYQTRYPNYKFILRSDVERICEKYDLVCGDASNFTGTVPERNLREIEAFKVDHSDRAYGFGLFGSLMQIQFYPLGRFFEPEFDSPMPAVAASIPFKICAPEKDFKMERTKKLGRFLVPDDPIVLCPVNGGFLIVTKWGLEAKDEDLVNEVMN